MILQDAQRKDLAEVVARTRRDRFQDAFDRILPVVEQIVADIHPRQPEAERGMALMIRDYRALIAQVSAASSDGAHE